MKAWLLVGTSCCAAEAHAEVRPGAPGGHAGERVGEADRPGPDSGQHSSPPWGQDRVGRTVDQDMLFEMMPPAAIAVFFAILFAIALGPVFAFKDEYS